MAGIVMGACVLLGGSIGGLFGYHAVGYEIGAAAGLLAMGYLNWKRRYSAAS
ncbi:hypothetical protein [Cohnella caldifontis]|uniref:hypothetical protein n=1 Tax=Cohnella caldifontis TaxID=3027471 RepID=UPI0023EC03D0|nr:hypothetical protein [Cohnella sp. YIM B05605]